MKHESKKILYVQVHIDQMTEVAYPASECSCGSIHPITFKETRKGFIQTNYRYLKSDKNFVFAIPARSKIQRPFPGGRDPSDTTHDYEGNYLGGF